MLEDEAIGTRIWNLGKWLVRKWKAENCQTRDDNDTNEEGVDLNFK